MTDNHSSDGIFVTAGYAMQPGGGGVQRCTREYLRTLEEAGYRIDVLQYEFDRHPLTRLRRKLFPAPYRNLIAARFVADVARAIHERQPSWVFFNQIEAAQIVKPLASLRSPRCRFALLSHGVDSSDYLHSARIEHEHRGRPLTARDARWLGGQLFAEMQQQGHFDVVFCLSEIDRTFHEWLGARSVHIVPRTVDRSPVIWRPVPGRFGTIGTLDHQPNYEGILLFCEAAKKLDPGFRLRVVGRPAVRGRELAASDSAIEYLGELSDEEFQSEASTWSVFINAIFSFARGATTKLAVPLGWQVPVASTRAGARGYWWDEAILPLAHDPTELARLAAALNADHDDARRRVTSIAEHSPSLSQVGIQVRATLNGFTS